MVDVVHVEGYGETVILETTRIDGELFAVCLPNYQQMAMLDKMFLKDYENHSGWVNYWYVHYDGPMFTYCRKEDILVSDMCYSYGISLVDNSPAVYPCGDTSKISYTEVYPVLIPLGPDMKPIPNAFDGIEDGEIVEGGSIFFDTFCLNPKIVHGERYRYYHIGDTDEFPLKWFKFGNALYASFVIYHPETFEKFLERWCSP